jgi:hypothetical protein
MRSVMRVGAIGAVMGCLTAFPLALRAGLVVIPLLLLLGVGAGLAMAKWLDFAWFGRQIEAGWKVGAIACVPAGVLALLTLLIQGPHDLNALVDASRLGGVDMGSLARFFGFAGWAGADIFGVLLGTAAAVGLATLTTLVFAISKSARAVQVITQAREAAQALRRGTWGPTQTSVAVPALPSTLSVGAVWQGMTSPSTPAVGSNVPWKSPASLGATSAAASPSLPFAQSDPPGDAPSPADLLPPPANRASEEEQLRAAMREALAMWGEETGEHAATPAANSSAAAPTDEVEQPTERRKRAPKQSAFLNAGVGGKKRARKTAATRDWLC